MILIPGMSVCQIKVLGTFLITFFAGILTEADIDSNVFQIYAIMIMIDTLTGLFKSYRFGHHFKSVTMTTRLTTKFVLLLIPIVVGLAAKALTGDFKIFYVYVMNLLIFAELYSIIGNAYAGASKKDIPEWDVVVDLSSFIRNFLFKRK